MTLAREWQDNLMPDEDDFAYEAWIGNRWVDRLIFDEDDRAYEAWLSRPVEVEPGMYTLPDGTVVKVQIAVHGSKRPYAKRLTFQPGEVKGTFVYEPGLIRRLTPDMRMTHDQATAFGHLYGMCCVCGATLTDEKSIAAGIGPICGGRL